MAIDPLISAALINLLGSGISSVFAPDGQEIQSFADSGLSSDIHPAVMLEQAKDMITRMGQAQGERAFAPVSLPSAYVQQPGVYTGGGLPMPIGFTAADPALADPGLLSLPGASNYDPFQSLGIIGTPFAPRREDARGNGDAGDGDPVMPVLQTATLITGQRSHPSASGVLTDDLEQALGAVDLLMRAHMGAV